MSKLEQYAGQGTDTIQDVKQAYLKIAQDISDEVKKQKEAYIPDLEVGQLFCSSTKEVFGSELDVIVLATMKSYLISEPKTFKFKGAQSNYDNSWLRDEEGRLKTRDGDDVLLCYNYKVVLADRMEDYENLEAESMVLTLKKSDIPAARDWNTMIKNRVLSNGATAPLFATIWTLKTQYREDGSKSWWGLCDGKNASIKAKGFIEDAYVDALADANTAIAKAQLTGRTQAAIAAPVDDDTKY
jgi:hypothetical protein